MTPNRHSWAQPPSGPAPVRPKSNAKKIILGVVGGLVLVGGCNAMVHGGQPSDQKPVAARSVAPVMPSASAAAGRSAQPVAPASPVSSAPAVVTTSAGPEPTVLATGADGGCGPTRDLIVRYVVPGLPSSAQVLGNHVITTCQDTMVELQSTSPKESGYCTEAAWASDNPGYDADATPAAPLKKVQVAYGPACR
ncbi:hypothetical protein [Streptomyces tateyamensis]|uniref:hypothetical protein n=1 Tax=Streptomyces tateyamensis TaxID=565073 RepID=UPI0011B80DD3|nr:hypothetical protein [Streptomyces tateyamensis]